MPGEPAAAYQGRLAIFFGSKSWTDFNDLARQYLRDGTASGLSTSKFVQLAAIAGMSSADFARQHSMLGLFRLVVAAKDWAPFGSRNKIDDDGYVPSRSMHIHRGEACLCPQCVEEDLKHWKFSWFRRSHQVEGIAWCPSHKVRLQRVTASDPWLNLPQHFVESGEVQEVPGGQKGETEFEARYAEIAMSMLERPAPFYVEALTNVLSERAQSLGLRRSRSGRRKNLSDHLLQKAPLDWVQKHWPNVASKSPGDYVDGLDRVISRKAYAQRGTSYVTAMAIMWDSTLELHQALQTSSAIKSEKVKSAPQVRKNSGFWQGEVWDAYLRCEGHIGRMAFDLGIERTYLTKRLPELGLVPLKKFSDSPERRAFLRFEAGESLRNACDAEKANIDDVEALIRVSCTRQAIAVRKIDQSMQSKKSIDPDEGQSQRQRRAQEFVEIPGSVGCV